jgi:hypothetical protein
MADVGAGLAGKLMRRAGRGCWGPVQPVVSALAPGRRRQRVERAAVPGEPADAGWVGGWAFLAVMLGALIGAATRRTVPAMA